MEGEVNNFIMVWVLVYVSACYCYAVAKIIPKGTTRLITFLPVVSLFLFLPLNYLHSINLGGATSFFISWLGNFKLLMFAFDMGPLADPSLSLGHFVALACLPIKFQKSPPPQPPNLKKPLKEAQREKPKNDPNKGSPYSKTSKSSHESTLMYALKILSWAYPKSSKTGLESPLMYALKALSLAMLVHGYGYSNKYFHPKVVRFQIIMHLCANQEILFAMFAALAQVLLRTKVEPQSNDPHRSTSLQDFWSRRWNPMVSDTMRSSVYKPIQSHLRPILGHEWSHFLALMGSYLVSGLMHELVYYQMGRLRPKWGSTLFFLIHGLCLAVEIAMKKKFSGTFQLPPVISGVLALGFVLVTYSRLILSELLEFQIVDRLYEEYVAVGTFMKDIICLCTSNTLFTRTFI